MLKMAFRNMFRNKKRTFFTMLSIIFGVGGIIFGVSYMEGIEILMSEETRKLTGDLRIVDKEFAFKSKIFDISSNIEYEDLQQQLEGVTEIENTQPKIRFAAYVFSGEKDDPAIGMGIGENDIVNDKIFEGRQLNQNNKGEVLVGIKLKERMDLEIGDSIMPLVSTLYGSVYARNYKIVGFYDLNSMVNKGFYLTLNDAMYLLDMNGLATELQINLKDKDSFIKVKKQINNILDNEKYTVETWSDVGFASVLEIYKYMKIVIAVILGLLSGIGIFNTMMMAVYERKHEIGVIKAMGMENKGIVRLITLEGTLIGVFGALIGILLGGAGTLYYQKNGIYLGSALDSISTEVEIGDTLYTHLSLGTVMLALVTGLVVAILASYFPARRETKREAVENLSDF